MMTRSEYVPLPASRSRFTVFQRRSERQHLQLAITSRRARCLCYYTTPKGPSLPPPPTVRARLTAGRPTRARQGARFSRGRACPCTKFTCDPSTAGARAIKVTYAFRPGWWGRRAGKRGGRGSGGPRCVRGAPGRRGVAPATAANSHAQRGAPTLRDGDTLRPSAALLQVSYRMSNIERHLHLLH